MTTEELSGYLTCENGFLTDASLWDRRRAESLAKVAEIENLSAAHWEIIEYVREYFLQHGQGPPIVKVARATGRSAREICALFPCGLVRGAYRIAGLPRPPGCI